MSKKVKIFVIVILCIAALIAASAFFGNSDSKSSNTGSLQSSAANSKAAGVSSQSPTTSQQDNEFSVLLATVKSISIDTSIFSNPVYRALQNYPVALGTDFQGRPNPFAQIGYDVGTMSSSGQTQPVQFSTLQPGKIKSTSAELSAQVLISDPTQATVVFEYGSTDTFGSSSAPIAISKSGAAVTLITGLVPETTYYVRAVLVQGSNQTPGNTMTFTTLKGTVKKN